MLVLEAVCERAQAVLVDGVHVALDANQFQRFVDLLDAASPHNAGLERMLAMGVRCQLNVLA